MRGSLDAVTDQRGMESTTTPLHEQAYTRIRDDLLSGHIDADHRLVATDLADALQMSRTPVRDALKRLEMLGLVEPLSGQGYRPRRTTARELRDLIDLRLLLEPRAAACLVELPAEERDPLARELIEHASQEPDPLAGHRFHATLARACPNPYLGEAVQLLNERMAPHRRVVTSARMRASGAAITHGAIAQAVLEGDQIRAADLARDHLAQVRGDLLGQEL